MLKHSTDQYKALIDNDRMFSSFTNYDILNVINADALKLKNVETMVRRSILLLSIKA